MSQLLKKLKSIIGKAYFKYLIILFAFLFWITFLDTNSLLIHAELNSEIKKLKKRVSYQRDLTTPGSSPL